jgi:hypothetical protein
MAVDRKVRTFAPYKYKTREKNVNDSSYRNQYGRMFRGRIGGLTSDFPTR